MPEKKTYKVVTSRQETEFIEADRVERGEDSRNIDLYLGDELVGSFIAYSSFCVYALIESDEE